MTIMSVWALTPESLARARQTAARNRRALMDVLGEEWQLSPERLLEELAGMFGYQRLTLADMQDLAPALDMVGFSDLARQGCLLLRKGSGLLFVCSDPFDEDQEVWASGRIPCFFQRGLALPADINAYLAGHEAASPGMDHRLPVEPGTPDASLELELTLNSIHEDGNFIIRLVNATLYDALKSNASDIHLETTDGGLTIKYRIDGVLLEVSAIPGAEVASQVVSRIKILADLDIAEQRVPQDGRFKVMVNGRRVDFRVSVMPSFHGEDVVLRLLDRQILARESKQQLRLDSLGFDAATTARIRKLATAPHGMLLVTGPTGSGKTTTLYATISEIQTGLEKIVTIEDPIEYQIAGILQVPVSEKKGLTFAKGLRSILRHDPDKIMVGEIRDLETAQIAIQSALTGHLVVTSVHANNVFDVIGRFIHMGIDPYNFVAALNGIVAQRLVRLNCPECSKPCTPSAQLLQESKLGSTEGYRFARGEGCHVCRGSGYKGRRAIAELLEVDDEIRELIIARAPVRKMKEMARQRSIWFLRDAALGLVKEGKTTLEEINRVTFSG